MTKSKLSLPDLMYITLVLCSSCALFQLVFKAVLWFTMCNLDDNKKLAIGQKLQGQSLTITIGFIGGLPSLHRRFLS